VNKYLCSNGERVSQAVINRRRSAAYRAVYEGEPRPSCRGCGVPATCSAHIIAQARAKEIGMAELCWSPENFFPSCQNCNQAIEIPSGTAWHSLLNRWECLEVIKKYDPELYQLFMNNAPLKNDLLDYL